MNLKTLLSSLFGGRIKKMPVDDQKIANKVTALNNLEVGANKAWIPVNGFNVMPEVKVSPTSLATQSQTGIVVKAFVNTVTGELRFFPLIHFKKEEEKK